MKNTHPTKQSILSLLIICLGFSCCKKDDESAEPDEFPYFHCIINGEFYTSKGSWQCTARTFNYYPDGFLGSPSGYTILSGTDCPAFKNIGIRIYGLSPTLDTIDMTSSAIDSLSPFYRYTDSQLQQSVLFDDLQTGWIKFEDFSDQQNGKNGIVSGTFEFTIRNEELDSTLSLTDGEFQYIIDYEWY